MSVAILFTIRSLDQLRKNQLARLKLNFLAIFFFRAIQCSCEMLVVEIYCLLIYSTKKFVFSKVLIPPAILSPLGYTTMLAYCTSVMHTQFIAL